MRQKPFNPNRHVACAAVIAAVLLPAAAFAGHPSGAESITVSPGDTGNCATNPCQVSLVMPAGEGSYEVTANEVSVGSFPAGETANLGNFFSSQAFAIKGADVPKAYVYMPEDL